MLVKSRARGLQRHPADAVAGEAALQRLCHHELDGKVCVCVFAHGGAPSLDSGHAITNYVGDVVLPGYARACCTRPFDPRLVAQAAAMTVEDAQAQFHRPTVVLHMLARSRPLACIVDAGAWR